MLQFIPPALRLSAVLLAVGMFHGGAAGQTQTPAAAASCSRADLAAVIDGMGAQLRSASTENQARMQSKLRQLAALKGWADVDAEEKLHELLDDAQGRALDERAGQLLVQLERLGPSDAAEPTCAQLAGLRGAARQLMDVTQSKANRTLARLDAELKVSPPVPPAVAKAPQTPAQTPAQAVAEATTPAAPLRPTAPLTNAPPPAVAQPLPAKPVRPAQTARLPWQEPTVTAPDAVVAAEPPAPLPPPAPLQQSPADLQFSVEDIRAAGRGFFGTISAELAGVIEYAFSRYGRPTGYILGTEGGAALLAGLRYGEGTLVTKRAGERRIYWQGPSVGYDFGLAGSRTLVLVYNLEDTEDMFARFGGIDGSAYLVGGVGLTILKKGAVILAPIRTGLGLRIGANVGYLKFTPKPSFNPF